MLEDHGIPAGLACKVIGFQFYDEDNGHILLLQPEGTNKKIPHPLMDLVFVPTGKKTKATKKMADLLEDYAEWAEDIL